MWSRNYMNLERNMRNIFGQAIFAAAVKMNNITLVWHHTYLLQWHCSDRFYQNLKQRFTKCGQQTDIQKDWHHQSISPNCFEIQPKMCIHVNRNFELGNNKSAKTTFSFNDNTILLRISQNDGSLLKKYSWFWDSDCLPNKSFMTSYFM